MRRAGNLWPQIISFENLLQASRRAALGKRRVKTVAVFLDRVEPEVLQLQRELESGLYRPGEPTTFVIRDPKERTITVAPFRDRVVHHALIDPLEPIFERRMIADSFACRRGLGTHRALRRAQAHVRRYAYSLKLDVRKCFDSIGHNVVMDMLGRILKDRRVLALAERIVRAGGDGRGMGLPIGNLTSQWFANLVLDRLDHHVKEVLRVPGYVRYMDDFVLFSSDKRRLRAALSEVQDYLKETLHLELKERATRLAPAHCGLPFLGWSIFRGTMRLQPENRRRTKARLRHRAWQHRTGRIDEAKYVASLSSVFAHLQHGSTLGLRRQWVECLPP